MERDTHVGGTTCLYLTPALESTSSLDEDHSSLVGGNKVWKGHAHVGGTTCLYLTPALERTSSLDEDFRAHQFTR